MGARDNILCRRLSHNALGEEYAEGTTPCVGDGRVRCCSLGIWSSRKKECASV